MRAIRLILILLTGGVLTFLTCKTKYQTFFFEAIIWAGFMLIGFIVFIWTVIKDIQLFKSEKRSANFTLTALCLVLTAIIFTIALMINNNFNKPTLLKVFYDGDFNGSGIDFKTDGTYIFDNSAIGMSEYFYGTYKINGNKIIMDRDQIDNITNLKYMEIKNKQAGNGKTDAYLYAVDSAGHLIEQYIAYRVITDNRKSVPLN